ncbi:MAG: FeoA family protein [Candidatus Methanofastidiosa archaeon]|jgi:Fe2+ transport system protein FeoA|nr:FeoA family protein [Candidatus Methanofastidiosa archaeon]
MAHDMPLSAVPEGSTWRVSRIAAGYGLSRRLSELGFVGDAAVSVCGRTNRSIIVRLCGQRYALSRGIAQHIYVSEASVHG